MTRSRCARCGVDVLEVAMKDGTVLVLDAEETLERGTLYRIDRSGQAVLATTPRGYKRHQDACTGGAR